MTGRRAAPIALGAVAIAAVLAIAFILLRPTPAPPPEPLPETPVCDYRISGGRLALTRDHGQTWIDADATAEEVEETLEFYRNGLFLPPSSVFISTDRSLPVAYFSGGSPLLHLTADDGAQWTRIPFPTAAEFGRAITRRVIGFATPDFGYAALGTDWSMGAGEHKMCYFSYDGGLTWEEKELPLTMTSHTLAGLAMADESRGIAAFDTDASEAYPVVSATADAGDTWAEIALPFDEVPVEVGFLSDVKGLSFEQGTFTLALGQGNQGTRRALFEAEDVQGPWRFAGIDEVPIHLVG